MRILVVCQHYWPEPFNTSDVCEGLVGRGHEVTVLTGMPNTGLPGNEIPEAYRGKGPCEESRNGVRIVRVPLHPRKSGAVHRVLNYLSFWRNANRAARHLDGDFDVVLGYQFSPVMQVDPGIAYARKHGVRMMLYCFDLWPASLIEGGFSEKSLPFRWMKSVSRRIYSQADRLAVTSPLFDDYFRSCLGLEIEDSVCLPQYADDAFLGSASEVPEGYDPDKINLTFAGNVGKAQSVSTIVRAAGMVSREDIVFHIVGSGSDLESCLTLAKKSRISNVIFHGRKPVEAMPSYYAASDAMVVTLSNGPVASYTLPRKVTTYLAAGKPVLAAAPEETCRVVCEAGCGICCAPEDAEGFARVAVKFATLPLEKRTCMEVAARGYYENHFTKDRFFGMLERELEELRRGEE